MSQQPTLGTARLILRPFALTDASTVQHLAGAYDIASTTLNIPHPYEDGVAEAWIETHPARFADGTSVSFAVVLRESGQLIGAIGLIIEIAHRHGKLGYWVGVPYCGQGYCTEAARAVLRFGFAELGLHRIHASHFARNPASGRVMQKVGMIYEGRRREHMLKWDRFEDMDLYGILARDWTEVGQDT